MYVYTIIQHGFYNYHNNYYRCTHNFMDMGIYCTWYCCCYYILQVFWSEERSGGQNNTTEWNCWPICHLQNGAVDSLCFYTYIHTLPVSLHLLYRWTLSGHNLSTLFQWQLKLCLMMHAMVVTERAMFFINFMPFLYMLFENQRVVKILKHTFTYIICIHTQRRPSNNY